MSVSEAKLLANRRNAALSTGPRTPEGKARSRQNALKHGLTGSGVALPSEDQAEIADRFRKLQEQMKPQTVAGEQLLRRFAFLGVRIERCERHETKETAIRVRHAAVIYDDERLLEVERMASMIDSAPATSFRRLQTMPEGIDWLLDEWEILRADLLNPDRDCWSPNHRPRFDVLLGRNPGGYRVARIKALSDARSGYFHHLDKVDGEGLEGPARAEWAKNEMTRIMDAEMARLKQVRIELNTEKIAIDRAEAADRALFDPSPEATLARKYEAATERAMYKAFKEFRQVEADHAAGIETSVSPCEVEEDDPVGSNLQETDEETPEIEPDPRSIDFDPSEPTFLNFSIGRAPEIGPKLPEPIGSA